MIFTYIIISLTLILVYSIVLYPVLLIILSKLFKKEPKLNLDFKPAITFIIAAYNEEKFIYNALQSIVELDYKQSNIQVIVGSDGSSDKTIEIANSFKDKLKDLTVLDLKRSGKNNVLNQAYKYVKNEFIYILDADFRLQKDSINKSIAFFADDDIGAVISKLNISSDSKSNNAGEIGEGAYQRLDNFIKVKEADIWTTVNNFGCYGIRKNLIIPIPNNKVCDDMFNILQVASTKKRVFITNDSVVNEVREKFSEEEIKRRERISAGSISTLLAVPQILNPRIGWANLFYLSHRFTRIIYPILILLILALTPFLYNENKIIFYIFFFGQVIFYLFSLIGFILDKKKININIFSFPYFFIMLNIGYFKGIIQFFKNEQIAVWERADTLEN